MKHLKRWWLPLLVGLVTGLGLNAVHSNSNESTTPAKTQTGKPALSVQVTRPDLMDLPLTLNANGSVAAWQEAIIGAEVGGLRLVEVRAQVGDKVKKGQTLAEFDQDRVQADVEQSRAALAEAEANLEEARLNAKRVDQVINSGALSDQQVGQYLTGEKTAQARMRSAKAQLDQQLLRLRHVRVIASDDGVISSRTATPGAVANEGQELFRLIRQNRLEWRAEVTAAELRLLSAGANVTVEVPDTGKIAGKLRMIGPTLSDQSRNALVYVDLPSAGQVGFKPGMFAYGEFQLGKQAALTVPQTALSLREGFSYVFRIGDESDGLARVSQVKVELGRRSGERIEIVKGISAGDKLVLSGASFLADGDSVRLVR